MIIYSVKAIDKIGLSVLLRCWFMFSYFLGCKAIFCRGGKIWSLVTKSPVFLHTRPVILIHLLGSWIASSIIWSVSRIYLVIFVSHDNVRLSHKLCKLLGWQFLVLEHWCFRLAWDDVCFWGLGGCSEESLPPEMSNFSFPKLKWVLFVYNAWVSHSLLEVKEPKA